MKVPATKQDRHEAESQPPAVIDAAQLGRIESVHRGFLYQHLYAVACLLLAQRAGASAIVVEHDEDLEIVLPDRRIYVQVKTRNGVLTHSDIKGALERFDVLRTEHSKDRRTGTASFVIAANAAPGPTLLAATKAGDWPADVAPTARSRSIPSVVTSLFGPAMIPVVMITRSNFSAGSSSATRCLRHEAEIGLF